MVYFLSVNICLTKNKDKKAQPFGRMKVKKVIKGEGGGGGGYDDEE